MATVTKKELIDRIAERTQAKRITVKRIVQALLDEIVNELSKNNRLEFRDFGVFETRTRSARVAKDPRTGKKVDVPVKRAVKFKMGLLMRDNIELTGKGSVTVYIYLPHVDVEEDVFLIDQVRNAVGLLMEAFDFELDPETQPIEIVGSWFTEIVFKGKGNASTHAIQKLLSEMHEAGHLQAIDLAEAEVFGKRANAVANLLKQLEYVDEAVIRLGDVLFVKAMIDGRTRVVIENITPSLARELAKKPQLMHEPEALIRRVEAKITS